MLTLSAHAQTPAGRWLVTGGLSLASNSSADALDRRASNSGISISPALGYFVANHLAVGLTGSAGYSRAEQEMIVPVQGAPTNTYTRKYSAYRVGVFGRYYWHMSEKTALTTTLSAGIGRNSQKYGYTDPLPAGLPTTRTESGRSIGASLTPAFVYFPAPRLGLEVSIGNLYASRERRESTSDGSPDTGKTTEQTVGASFNFSNLSVGASLFFGGGE